MKVLSKEELDKVAEAGHHVNYYKPLKVIWLCNIHHMALHSLTDEEFLI